MAAALRIDATADGPSPLLEAGLRAFAALASHLCVKDGQRLPAVKATILREPVSKLDALLRDVAPLGLFTDLVPSAGSVAVEMMALDDGSRVFASHKEASARAPLVDAGGEYWVSQSGSRTAFWGVKFGAPVALARILVTLKEGYLPESLTVDTCDIANKDAKTSPTTFAADSSPSVLTFSYAADTAPIRTLQLSFTGTHERNSNGCVAVERVRIFCRKARASASTVPASFLLLSRWLSSLSNAAAMAVSATAADAAATSSAAAALADAPLAALADDAAAALTQLARVSGSARVLLQLQQLLLQSPQRALSPSAASAGLSLVGSLRARTRAEAALQSALEYLPAAAAANTAAKPTFGVISGARFDSLAISSSLALSEEDCLVSSVSSAAGYAAVNVGPFAAGKAAWTFKLVKDTSSPVSALCMARLRTVSTARRFGSCAVFSLLRMRRAHVDSRAALALLPAAPCFCILGECCEPSSIRIMQHTCTVSSASAARSVYCQPKTPPSVPSLVRTVLMLWALDEACQHRKLRKLF